MTEIINALWSLQTWLIFLVGVTAGLAIGALMVAARRNSEDEDGPPTILILPPDEPMPPVDVRGMLRRYE